MKKVALIVLDGFGYSKKEKGNAVNQAKMPFYNDLLKKYPHSFLRASGKFVGLKNGQMGNSETGHMNIGAGRVVSQDLTILDNMIETKAMFENPVLIDFFEKIKHSNGIVHFVGLLSNGGIHSHMNHLFALIKMAKLCGVKDAFVHVITDGRDTDIHSGIGFLKQLETLCKNLNFGKIATIQGRFYAMDRDKHYDYTKMAYDAIISAKADSINNPNDYLKQCYTQNVTDEFVVPAVVKDYSGYNNNTDGLMFYNFRKDRTKQLTQAFLNEDFDEFETPFKLKNLLTMVNYGDFNCKVVLENHVVNNCLTAVLSDNDKKIGKFSEPTKFPHITYFLNGGREQPFKNELWFKVPAKNVKTFDLAPQMSAIEIAREIVKQDKIHNFDFVMANIANCDMVGHTGNIDATIKALEAVDKCLQICVPYLLKNNFDVLITADHGNAEQMIFRNKICTTHTNNPVRLVYASKNQAKLVNGSLIDIAPTILSLFDIPLPKEYTGKNLIKTSK